MDKLGWHLAWGLCLLRLSLAQIDLNITCRYAGVFHVEKNGRYSISRTEAADLCKAFNSTLPTMAQMERALSVGFETCRYGFIEGHVVIPRIQPNAICAANHTGVYILISNTSQYDTYCFNASAPPEEDCTSVTHLPNAFDGPITITIVNRDGTRYSQKGEYRTNPEDINPSNPTDDDVSSGSSSERSTSAGYNIFHTHLPTAYPTEDQDSSRVSSNSDHTPITTTAQDSHPDQKTTTQSQEDSSWTYFFDPISHPMGPGHQTERWMDMDSSHSPTSQPSADPNTHLVEDLDRIGPLSMTTQQSHTQSFSTSPGGLEEDKNHPTASTPTSNRTDGRGGREGGHLPEDSAPSVEASPSHSPATNEYRTLIPVTPAKTGFPGVTEVNIAGDSNSNVIHFLSEDHDSSVHPSERSHTTHGSESAGHSSGSQEGGANTTSGPMRKPQIPEWLIILASLLALALILAVCIAVNSRRRCGQKKKLVINNGNGAVGDRKPSGINGEASKSQEMVHLVNKEPSETPDQYTTADETRNLQNVDMKIGV
ncbi:CD44 antigen isoform X11 [Canis lupus dingo]|uniref:CD44 antigen n=1 Tax=Canis lupus familiaris TaxID=9615 RepID=A0A8C0PRF5_CANLF|nr:CD44 antigen isoform X11 [Canis lupus dingo]XP_038279312.1 CD44 antigen isoform X11 [Canis lupus familiaris]|eukprot:XP_005631093.1 CD44 antigen isoform X8 [Canis lupus familiaris]